MTKMTLRPGAVVTYTCRGVDPQGRTLMWSLQTPDGVRHHPDDGQGEGNEVELTWEVKPVRVHTKASLHVILTVDGQYHRFGATGFDAVADFRYEVLPPLV